MDGNNTLTLTLRKPLDGVSEITLREPTVDEGSQFRLDARKFGDVRALKSLLSKLSGLEVGSVGQMAGRDFKVCERFVQSRFGEPDEVLEGDEVVWTLQSPLPSLTEVKLREPTLDEFARMTSESARIGDVLALRNLIAAMNKVEAGVVGRMGIGDFKVCDKYLSSFFD